MGDSDIAGKEKGFYKRELKSQPMCLMYRKSLSQEAAIYFLVIPEGQKAV